MNVVQFVAKWRPSKLNERSGSQEHFIDLCRAFDHPTPGEGHPKGLQFLFEKNVAKADGRRGRADVWKEGDFAVEYKTKSQGKHLEEAHNQLRQYRESLLNPPLLVACDMDVLDIRTNFTRRETKHYVIPLSDLADKEYRLTVERMFHRVEELEPKNRVDSITEAAAEKLARVAERMRARDLDPAQVAIFLDRVIFCLFAQDVGLLGERVFSAIFEKIRADADWASREICKLFEAMDKGGEFFLEKIPYFNGNLFADVKPLALTHHEIDVIKEVSRFNWRDVDPSILGTLFERGVDPAKGREVGTNYTSRADIETLIRPVIMEPLRLEWQEVRAKVEDFWRPLFVLDSKPKPRASSAGRDPAWLKNSRKLISGFLQRLTQVSVLDPACGSGNFLFVALQMLKDLEKEVIVFASELQIDTYFPLVGPMQLKGIEKSPFGYDLTRTTVLIGWLQWTKANGYSVDWRPVLSNLDGIRNIDAILDRSDPESPNIPEWPEAEFIVGNPPFLGGKRLRATLGDDYVDGLFEAWEGEVKPEADLCCYWLERARQQVEAGKCRRAGLIATQGVRGGASRKSLDRIKNSGDIFFALSDRNWILDGAAVHTSMIGFDNGSETVRVLDEKPVDRINSDLTGTEADLTTSKRLPANLNIAFMGDTKGGSFEIDEAKALGWLHAPNPNGKPNSDVVVPWINGIDVTRRPRNFWIIDFGTQISMFDASGYELPFGHLDNHVRPQRSSNKRPSYRDRWWIHVEARPAMRRSFTPLRRYLVTNTVSKHRLFCWFEAPTLADHQLIAFGRSDDFFQGLLHSRVHEIWARALGTQVRERESGFRYTPTTCFETFPMPEPFAAHEEAIGLAMRQLEQARSRWLNPPEWTKDYAIEFPASVDGPWSHLLFDAGYDGIGTARYTRRVARDAKAEKELAVRTLTNLYNQRPTWLDLAHRQLDEAVAAAYGWPGDLSEAEILARLLTLNDERAATEESEEIEILTDQEDTFEVPAD